MKARTRSRALAAGCVLVGVIAAMALITLFWTPYDPADTSGGRLEPPGAAHLLGTDRLGRDLLTQVMLGARVALLTAAGSVVLGGLLGLLAGLVAGLATRWLDDALAVLLDILIAFPTLLLAMLMVAAGGTSLGAAIVAIGLAVAVVIARLVRLLAKRVLAQDYVTAARTSGTSWPRIMTGPVLRNIWPALAVGLSVQVGLAVLAEATLSYLGMGAPPPNPSWGQLLKEAQATAITAPAGLIAPGLLLATLVVGVNLIAQGLREHADPTLRRAQ